MRYPIDEKTKKPYNVPKGAEEPVAPKPLDEVNKEKLKNAVDEVEKRSPGFKKENLPKTPLKDEKPLEVSKKVKGKR